jgi:hypothetical protein
MGEARWILQAMLRLRTLLRRNRVERELDEEFQFHIEQRVELEIASGRSPEEARLIALRSMAGMALHMEECRDMRRVNSLTTCCAIFDMPPATYGGAPVLLSSRS